ncbi:MAG TPA: hypothetical protein VGE64_09705 [Xanthomonadaceae bacterium]
MSLREIDGHDPCASDVAIRDVSRHHRASACFHGGDTAAWRIRLRMSCGVAAIP